MPGRQRQESQHRTAYPACCFPSPPSAGMAASSGRLPARPAFPVPRRGTPARPARRAPASDSGRRDPSAIIQLTNLLQAIGHGRVEFFQRLRRLRGMADHLADDVRVGKRRLARQQVIQHAAEAVNVGADVGGARVARLLGSHVIRRAEQHAFAGQTVLRVERRCPRQTAAGPTRCRGSSASRKRRVPGVATDEHQIGRLQIAVDEVLLWMCCKPCSA